MAPILQYADDTIFFMESCVRESQALYHMVNIFGEISCLKLNGGKSSLVCFGMNGNEQSAISSLLGTPLVSLPIKYLGLPLKCTKLKKSDWNILFEKVSVKLEGWSSRYLSKGGRLILLNSVIPAIPAFYFSVFKVPKLI
jgi:hypothetical protein